MLSVAVRGLLTLWERGSCLHLNSQEKKKYKQRHNNSLSAFQAYLIGTVNTIQSIQCSKTQAWATKWNTNEKVQNTPFGRPYKGKEVSLWKADKVMVRLSIVKIDVLPFKTLFIYSYIFSLISNVPFPLYRQVVLGHRLKDLWWSHSRQKAAVKLLLPSNWWLVPHQVSLVIYR